jgi:hypothetical protein
MSTEKRPLKVFLCHAHSDKNVVRDLYQRLIKDGIDAWLDKEKLIPGQDWELEIRKAVREADVIVVCLSKQFNQAGFRQKEVRLALDTAMEKPEGEIFIIPARLEECENLESLRKWHWVDLFEDDGYERLIRALRARAENIGATLQAKKDWPTGSVRSRKSGMHTSEKKSAELKQDNLEETLSSDTRVNSNTSDNAVVMGSNNVINMSTRTVGFLSSNMKEIERGKSHFSEERVLEAAIEKQVIVRKPASLFVWIRRQSSKNIISVVSAIDEKVLLDEDNVKAKGLEIEFPVEDGETLSAGITLRLVAHEFIPSDQQKKIIVPPKGDSEVCTFIVSPQRSGELLLSLEVLKDDVSLANRNLRTVAIDIEKKIDTTLLLVTIPIIVLVQTPISISDETAIIKAKEDAQRLAILKAKEDRLAREKTESERRAMEEAERLLRTQAENKKMESASRGKAEREAAEKAEREAVELAARRTAKHEVQEIASEHKMTRAKPKLSLVSIFLFIVSIILCLGLFNVLLYVYDWLQNMFR